MYFLLPARQSPPFSFLFFTCYLSDLTLGIYHREIKAFPNTFHFPLHVLDRCLALLVIFSRESLSRLFPIPVSFYSFLAFTFYFTPQRFLFSLRSIVFSPPCSEKFSVLISSLHFLSGSVLSLIIPGDPLFALAVYLLSVLPQVHSFFLIIVRIKGRDREVGNKRWRKATLRWDRCMKQQVAISRSSLVLFRLIKQGISSRLPLLHGRFDCATNVMPVI